MAFYGSLGEVNYNALDASITDTAVDVFVYDTTKDSDGGVWRHRTQHTSWYNEELNTITRGSRREFPAVAVLVLEGTQLTIYDGDDPDLPMWMVFNKAPNSYFSVTTNSCVTALNGKIVSGGNDSNDRLRVIDFLLDNEREYSHTDGQHTHLSPISGRNGTAGFTPYDSSLPGVISRYINDVAMTVLPNAPIDPSTGLPIPTIAVATSSGVSVIKDDGSVVDLTGFAPVHTIHIDSNSVIGSVDTSGNDYLYKTSIPTVDVLYNTDITAGSANYYMSSTSSSATIPILRDRNVSATAYNSKDDTLYRGGNNGLDVIKTGQAVSNTVSNSLITYLTSDYNTGWMHGDIKGAFLSDTDTTNISATNLNLITNGDFSNGTTGWSSDQILTESGGVASVQRNAGATGQCYQTITTEAGRTYTVSVNVTAYSNGFQVYAGEAPSAANITMSQGAVNATGTHYWTFTATSTSTRLDFSAVQSGTATASFDNITIFDGVADRSVNNKGLAVYGTITKSAVATGAELVAYGNWESDSAYLVRPYNSDTQFGTGDFSISYWIYENDNTKDVRHFFLNHDLTSSTETTEGFSIGLWNTNFRFLGVGGVIQSGVIHQNNVWSFIHCQRKSGILYLYINGEQKFSVSYGGNVNATKGCVIGNRGYATQIFGAHAKFALMRLSASVPSAEQIKKIYEDEKHLFQENAKCTLYGSSDAVTALAYDDFNDLLHVGTSSGRSDFQGLRRINNTTTAVSTAISASNDLIAEQ